MATVSLEIDGKRADLFKDESIVLNSRIKDITDIGRVGSDFSQTFSLPDSPKNRLIFKNFQNQDVINGFDARRLIKAAIRLNGFEFRQGVLSLDSVQLKEGKIDSYKVTFFGKTVSLKTIFKEDKLSSLTDLNAFDFEFLGSSVINGLKSDPDNNDIIFSLISSRDRVIYDSNTAQNSTLGNIAGKGVEYDNFKPSIRLKTVLNEVNNKYELGISSFDFVDDNLFLWLSNSNKTILESRELGDGRAKFIDFVYQIKDVGSGGNPPEDLLFLQVDDVSPIIDVDATITETFTFNIDFIANPFTTNTPYSVKLIYNDEIIYSNEFDGDANITANDVPIIFQESGELKIEVTALESNFENIILTADAGSKLDEVASGPVTVSNRVISVSAALPDIKVIDFLSGIFKMFNLVAFFEGEKLQLKTLSDYYSDTSSKKYDVSNYTNIDNIELKPVDIYSEIKFSYSGLKTFLASNHKDLFSLEWGTESYSSNEGFKGGSYNVSLPFEHLKYERLQDNETGNFTNIVYGWAVDEQQKQTKTKPLIYYNQFINVSGSSVNIIKEGGISDSIITSVNMPSNIKERSGSNDNLHFKREVDEFNFNILSGGTLFDRFYSEFIEPIYDIRSRMVKIRCLLPLNIMLRLKLNDVIIFRNKKYRINSFNANLVTMEVRFELINII